MEAIYVDGKRAAGVGDVVLANRREEIVAKPVAGPLRIFARRVIQPFRLTAVLNGVNLHAVVK